MTSVTLNCLVVGDDPYEKTFPVDIDINKNIGALKKAIKNDIGGSVSVRDLKLFKVNILLGSTRDENVVAILKTGDLSVGLEMNNNLEKISVHFSTQPADTNLHILVQLPTVAIEQPVGASVEDLADLFGEMNVTTASTSVSPLTMLAGVIKENSQVMKQNSEVMKQNSEIMKKMLIQSEKERDDTGSVTRAKAYQNIRFVKIFNPGYFTSKMTNCTSLGSFQNNGSVDKYLQTHPTPTATEEEVQTWFNDLMVELPNFNKKLVVEDTHKNQYLDGFMPDLSVFLEDDVRNGTYIPMFVQTLLEVKKKKNDSGLTDEDKGQLIDYMNVLIQHQPLRDNFALFLSDGFRFYVMVYERNTRQYREFTTNFRNGLRLFWVMLRYDSTYTKMAGPRNFRFFTSTAQYTDIHLMEFLGSGSSSTVYKVDYNDAQVALKHSKNVNPQHEAQILQLLNNNNIPNVPNYIAHDDHSIIISPVCKRISRDQFQSYHALQLLHLLKNIHSINVFHRDVRPENILLDTENDSLILADWGAAIHNPPNGPVHYEGTISFASPDILNNNLGFHQPKATDDLHSFVRSMYVLHNQLKMPTIDPNENLASKAQIIKKFWGDNVNVKLGGVLWREMVNAANSGDYQTLEKCCYIFKSQS